MKRSISEFRGLISKLNPSSLVPTDASIYREEGEEVNIDKGIQTGKKTQGKI